MSAPAEVRRAADRQAPRTARRTVLPSGTGALVRLALRRDRIRLSVWTLLTLFLLISLVSGVAGTYDTAAERLDYAGSIGGSAAAAAFSGPLYGLDTTGGIAVAESGTIVLLSVAVGSLLLAVRYTRTEEETGRAELVAAAPVGRHAGLAAALVVVGGGGLLIGAVSAALMALTGLGAAGSVAFGLALTLVGWVFTGVGTVTAQVFQHARTATGAAAAVLGAALTLRAVGDAARVGGDGESGLGVLSWLSPLGWAFEIRPFAGERWWAAALPLAAAMAAVALAAALQRRRDVDAGLIPARHGSERAAPWLGSALGLAWRLQRGALLGWGAGIALFAAAFGAFAVEMADMVSGDDSADVIVRLGGSGGALADSWIAWTLSIAGMLAAVYAVAAVLRMRAEEAEQRAEPVLATAVGRRGWAAGHLVVAALGAAAITLASGALVGLVHGLRAGDLGGQLPRVLGASLVQIPAALLMAGAAFAVVAFAPRLATAAWVLVVGALLLTQVGAALELSQAALNISPFTHTPKVPGSDVDAVPLLAFLGGAALLAAAGAHRIRHRDIGTA
ncbi:ABC transporter permease [Actinomadura sp. WMMB 499]|uniref:ABC transporter permease n=1 Tax=Actinomadura sp. WMMB 499 TaxID=1219491 RepID=UPI001243ADDF|nr:ABC transporter permease [Actinomadura sp. WMMB 499]QFG24808.1 ABC transporter permease [Actinomadura sp. WMMB 499]